jgi:hypothetical protein
LAVTLDEQQRDELTARLLELEQPGELVRVAGAWLVAALAVEGFGWLRSLGTLQRGRGDRVEQIHLHGLKWNRTGESIEFSSVLNVRDRGLRRWRRAHPEITPHEGGNDDWLCGHPFGNLVGSFSDGLVDLTYNDRRLQSLEEFVGKIRQFALPWFASTADPTVVVGRVPDQTLRLYASDLVEWLVYLGERASALALIERWLSLDPAHISYFRAGCDLVGRGKPGAMSREEVGWTSQVLGLV